MDILRKYFSESPNKPLHHYTTLRGFLGIINDRQIWATNIFYMNDQTELNRAINFLHAELIPRIELMKEERLKLKPRALGPETDPDVLKIEAKLRFFEGIKRIADVVDNNRFQFYVCSFTEHDDSLSQWRGYCEDGNGISIGYDFTGFKTDLTLRKCNYDERLQKQIIKELVDSWFYQLDSNIEANIKQTESPTSNFGIGAIISSHFVMECRNSFLRVAPFFKHPKYDEEAEWRIVIGGDESLSQHIKIVDSRYILKPYFCLNLDWLPKIHQIRIGPSSHIDLNESSAKLFLKSKNLSPDIVKKSDIPYRGKI